MIPFVIIWRHEHLAEMFDGNVFGCVEAVEQLDDVMFKYVDVLKKEYADAIAFHLDNETFDFGVFCEIVNQEPYNNSLFYEMRYFDVDAMHLQGASLPKTWMKREIDDDVMNEYLLKNE
jgi:hypothetical protein